MIALKRFQPIHLNDLCIRSIFTCTCVREFWKLLQLLSDKLHEKEETMVGTPELRSNYISLKLILINLQSFWMLFNRVCENILSNSDNPEPRNCSILSQPKKYVCSNPPSFVLWLLKDLAKLYKIDKRVRFFNLVPTSYLPMEFLFDQI